MELNGNWKVDSKQKKYKVKKRKEKKAKKEPAISERGERIELD